MTEASMYSPFLAITLAAVATYAARGAGAFLSGKIGTESAVIDWITCVTYALLAGLVVRMIWMPIGALAATPDWMRFVAAGTGLAVFIVARKSVGLGVLSGTLTLIALTWNAF